MVEMQPAATAASFTTHVLKDGDSFIVANAYGDIEGGSDGFFHNDTRLLSTFRLSFAGLLPEALSAAVTQDNVFFIAHLTNRPLPVLGSAATVSGLIHIMRTRFLCEDRLYERINCRNYGNAPVGARCGWSSRRISATCSRCVDRFVPHAANCCPSRPGRDGLMFGYCGLDGRLRTLRDHVLRQPDRRSGASVEFLLDLPSNGRDEIYLEVGTRTGATSRRAPLSQRRRDARRARCVRGSAAARACAAKARCSPHGWNARAPTWRC